MTSFFVYFADYKLKLNVPCTFLFLKLFRYLHKAQIRRKQVSRYSLTHIRSMQQPPEHLTHPTQHRLYTTWKNGFTDKNKLESKWHHLHTLNCFQWRDYHSCCNKEQHFWWHQLFVFYKLFVCRVCVCVAIHSPAPLPHPNSWPGIHPD